MRMSTLEEFLTNCVESCEAGAPNRICFRALFSQLYFAYRGRTMLRGETAVSAGDFLTALRRVHPSMEPARIRPESSLGALSLPDTYRGLELDGVRFLGAPWKTAEPPRAPRPFAG